MRRYFCDVLKKWKTGRKTLQFRVFYYSLGLLVFAIISSSILIYGMSSRIVGDKEGLYEKTVLNQMRGNIERNLDQIEIVGSSIAVNKNVIEYMKKISEGSDTNVADYTQCMNILYSQLFANIDIRTIYMTTNDGKEVYVGTLNQGSIEYEALQNTLNEYGDNPEKRWYYKVFNENQSDAGLFYIYTLKDYYKRDSSIGSLVIIVDPANVKKVVENASNLENRCYLITDECGQNIYVNKNYLMENELLMEKNILDEIPESTYARIKSGQKRYAASSAAIGEVNWKIYSFINEKEYMYDANMIRFIILSIGFCVILACLYLVHRFSLILTRDTNHLVGEMRQIAAGELKVRNDYQYEDDEIGFLKKNFDYMIERISLLIEEIQEKEKMTTQAELRALQYQINPHFLYNTLNTINLLAQMAGQREISETIINLGTLLRTSLDLEKTFIPVKEELAYLDTYVKINNVRYRGRFKLQIQCPDGLKNYMVPKLILQPIVENSIIHGFERKMDDCQISVCVEEKDNDLIIRIYDNGVGMTEEQMEFLNKKTRENPRNINRHIGIINVSMRLQLYYGGSSVIRFENNPSGGLVTCLNIEKMERD